MEYRRPLLLHLSSRRERQAVATIAAAIAIAPHRSHGTIARRARSRGGGREGDAAGVVPGLMDQKAGNDRPAALSGGERDMNCLG